MGGIAQVQRIDGSRQLAELLKRERLVVALVYATWCPYCMRFLPLFGRYAQERSNFYLVRDEQEVVAELYDVEVIPTILVFEDVQVTRRLDGVIGIGLSEQQLLDFIASF